jgi:hypothetical protein
MMDYTQNLLKETQEAIWASGHTIDQITFIGSEGTGHRCTWDDFCVLADREYDSGYGSPQVAVDLVIVFRDGQKLWRALCNGAEWWEFSNPFTMPEKNLPLAELFATEDRVGWRYLAELNPEGEAE